MRFWILIFFLILPKPSEASDPILYSQNLKLQFPESYYIDQSLRYFDTLDSFASRESHPNYSSHVIRWEWPPWLYLTGYKDHWMKLDRLLILYPTKVIDRNCKAFPVQPFARCRVTFHYLWNDHQYEIYEEFTFNDAGEITFIEAWSDEEGLLPMDPKTDYWAEGLEVKRLSTKVPGLGSVSGRYDRRKLRELARSKNGDPDLKNLLKRLRFPVFYWSHEALRFLNGRASGI